MPDTHADIGGADVLMLLNAPCPMKSVKVFWFFLLRKNVLAGAFLGFRWDWVSEKRGLLREGSQ